MVANESGLGDRNNNGNNMTTHSLSASRPLSRARRGYRVSFDGEKAATKGLFMGSEKEAAVPNK